MIHSPVCHAKVSSDVSAMKLTQTHYYWGDTETIISKFGVRINNKGRMKYSLVACSPIWKVTVFRDDDKTYKSQSLAQFEKTGLVSEFVLKPQGRILEAYARPQITDSKFEGHKTKRYIGPRSVFECLPHAEPAVEAIIYATYKVPTNGGIPIRYMKTLRGRDAMSGMDENGILRVYLKTKSIAHIMVPKTYFEPPKGYRQCQSIQEVTLSKVSRDASGDFDELFEINNPNRKKEH